MNSSSTSTGFHGPIAATVFGVLSLSLSLVSAADPTPASRTVKFADLNISDPSGAHALYMRIRAAAQVVCSYYWFPTEADKAGCVRDATADAVTRINRSALFAVYDATNKTSVPRSLPSQNR
jgi:UrcA family protein